MLTKNWYKMMATLMLGGKGKYWDVGILDTNGVSSPQYFNNSNTSFYEAYNFETELKSILKKYDIGVVFGTGNSPVTLDDYKLSGDIITTLSGACTISRGVDADGAYITALYTLNNNGNNDVIVSEIATIALAWKKSSSSIAYPMIDRTVLDTPVTIPASGIGQVEYTIRFNYPV